MSPERSSLPARAIVLDRLGELPTLAHVAIEPPGPGEVRVKMLTAGICHTDVAAMRDARTVPVVLGHEGIGVVESVGPGADASLVGTRALLAWKSACGACRRCRQGRGHLCEAPRGAASPRIHSAAGLPIAPFLDTGCFCDYVVVHEEAVIPIPDGLSDEHATLVGCAVATGVGAALTTARLEPGDFVAVWGAGGVGLNVVAGAALARAEVIVAVDPDPERREAALTRGATAVCAPEDALETIAAATGGHGADTAFEVVGLPETMSAAIDCLGVGGQLVLVGAAARDALLSFAPRRLMSRQQRIVGCIYGSVRPRFDLPTLLRLCADGTIPLGDLIGDLVTLDRVPAVFSAPPPGVRTVIRFT